MKMKTAVFLLFIAVSWMIVAAKHQYNRRRLCPFGLRRYSCGRNQCDEASCANVCTQCQPSNCGGCFTFFTQVKSKELITVNECDCPNTAPCLVSSCPRHECNSLNRFVRKRAKCEEINCSCGHRWIIKRRGRWFDVTKQCDGLII